MLRLAIIGDRGIPAKYSGFSTLVEQMATRMVSDYGMDVTVYGRRAYYDEHPERYHGVRCVWLPAPGGKNFESIIHSNLAIVHAVFCNYDAILLLDPGNAPFMLPLKLRRAPVFVHTDGMGWKRKKWSPLQQKYYKWSEWVSARLADWLITDSVAMQDYYVEEYAARSTYIPYAGEVGDGVDDSVLDEFGLTSGEYYICCARIEPDNNIDLIIREYRKLDTQRPLVVVGEARYDTEYGRAIARENSEHVRCIGGVYDKNRFNALLKHAYVYIHGHEVGGTNPSLLTALHMGAAPVCMNVVFHRQVVGEGGLFFDAAEGSLLAILRRLDDDGDEVERLRTLARKRSDRLYRWDAVVDAYVSVARLLKRGAKKDTALSEALSAELYQPERFADRAASRPGSA